MKSVPDRKKQRREYLKQKGKVYVKTGLAGVFYIPLAVATAFLALGAGFSWFGWLLWDRALNPGSHWDWYAIGLTLFALITWRLWGLVGTFYEHSLQSIHDIDYVPPVAPSTLPVEEVLVRGAAPPATTSGMLLRATVKGEETQSEELLRAGVGSENGPGHP
jgi:hypothetical protein